METFSSEPSYFFHAKKSIHTSSTITVDGTLRPGAQIVLEAVRLEEWVRTADLVMIAEGQLDGQTAYGMSVGAVAGLAKRYGLPLLALAGAWATTTRESTPSALTLWWFSLHVP
jgi:glycerate kinase